MLRVPDAASVATAHWLETQLGRKVGASTGTNMGRASWPRGCAKKAVPALSSRCCVTAGSATDTYYNAEWVQATIGDVEPWKAQISQLVK